MIIIIKGRNLGFQGFAEINEIFRMSKMKIQPVEDFYFKQKADDKKNKIPFQIYGRLKKILTC